MLYHALHAREGEAAGTAAIAGRLPDLHVEGEVGRSLAARPGERLIVKTHFPWSAAHPHGDEADRAVVLVRHPRDVLLSCLAFHRVLETKVKDRKTGRDAPLRPVDYARNFIEAGGDPVWMRQGFGTWEGCTRSWLDGSLETLLVRYEDLLDDPAGGLVRVLGFLGESVADERVERAVSASSFDAMRSLEVREKSGAREKNTFFGGSGRTLRRGVYFMDRARRGESLEQIGRGFDARFDERFGGAMLALGYA